MIKFSWDWAFAWSIMPQMLGSLVITVQATILGFTVAAFLGFVWVALRLVEIPYLSTAVRYFVDLIRGTPLLIQAYLIFFALPNYGLTLSPLVAGVTALGLYASSYVSEIYRAGLEAVPRGQWEACLTLGLPLRRVWGGVILPQTFRTVLPMMANIMIGMFKDSAILSTITLMELLGRALYIGAVHFRYTEPMTIAGGLFLIISYAAARLTRTLEIRYATKEA